MTIRTWYAGLVVSEDRTGTSESGPFAALVARVFEILREQMHIAMGLCGRTKIADLKPDLIFRADCDRAVHQARVTLEVT
jgi:hypothetical protein